MIALPRRITIIDRDLIKQITREQSRRGDGNAARTAYKLIIERLTELDVRRRQEVKGRRTVKL